MLSANIGYTQVEPVDTISYGMGMMKALELQNQGMGDINIDAFISAFTAVMNGEKTQLDNGVAQKAIQQYFNEKQEEITKMNMQQGEAFLTENAKREEVTVLASGLQYEVLSEGTGTIPGPGSKVTTHYTGTLIDGTLFDSSVERGEPISFPVNGVIQGWQEALQIMPQGSKWKLYIPQELAYGARGAGNVIPPFSALIFEIELLEVQ
jgi:FKBP-type peptidyl-prolyl cis-trans isomerase FklB